MEEHVLNLTSPKQRPGLLAALPLLMALGLAACSSIDLSQATPATGAPVVSASTVAPAEAASTGAVAAAVATGAPAAVGACDRSTVEQAASVSAKTMGSAVTSLRRVGGVIFKT